MSLILIEKRNESSLSKLQQTFNRQVKKLESLQKTLKKSELEMEEALRFYHTIIRPIEREINLKLAESIKLFYSFKKNPGKLSKDEQDLLHGLINGTISRLCSSPIPNSLDSEIQAIIEELDGINFQEESAKELSKLKNEIIQNAEIEGLTVDLSDISVNDSQEEIMVKLATALHEARANKAEEAPATASTEKKTKRQLEKEKKAHGLAEIQKKGLSTIYKQLAKALHPDLETDPAVKVEKEALMKRLTTAYEQNDLHTLLSLEIEWMNHPQHNGEGDRNLPEEQLKIYNAILKDQVDELKVEIERVSIHPKYFDMQHILQGFWYDTTPLGTLNIAEQELKEDLALISSTTAGLKGASPLKTLRAALESFEDDMEMEDMFGMDDDMFDMDDDIDDEDEMEDDEVFKNLEELLSAMMSGYRPKNK